MKDHFELPLLRAIDKSVFIKSAWVDMKAVVKATMMKNPNLFVRITSDREILDVYLGKKSRGSRGDVDGGLSRRARVDLEGDEYVYNSIEDLMKPANLCIVRLNEIGYKNKAAPGALEEGLSYRLDRDLPTWIISDLDKPYALGSFSYSESLMDMILTSTVGFQVPRIVPRVQFDLEEAMGLSAPSVIGPSAPKTTGTASVMANVSSSPDAPILDADPIDERPQREVRKNKIRSSEDMDAPKGLESIYGSGIKPSRKPRGRD